MTRTSQRLLAAVAVLLLVGGIAWMWVGARGVARENLKIKWGMEVEARPPEASFWVSGQPGAQGGNPPAPGKSSGGAGTMPTAHSVTQKKTDRYAGAAVVEENETTRLEAGETVTRRVRLVKVDDFKYPLVRVEDEWRGTGAARRLERQSAMVGDHVLVKLADASVTEAAFLKALNVPGASIRKRMPLSKTWLVAFANPTVDTVPNAVAQLSQMKPLVDIAEPDYIMHALAVPNDPSFGDLWGMNNTGQSGGVADADIDAVEAWDLHTGTSLAVVAVIDSGLDASHPDLSTNLWNNPGEIAGNAEDDDGNGYVDDVYGWDFANDDNVPNDDNGHGTHCAGTVGAAGNNATGVTGVCWRVSLMGLKFLNAAGNGSLSDAVEAISYATAQRVTLTSNSWGGGGYSQTMKDVIDEADAAGILFVAAAGNNSTNMDGVPGYPASYESENVISVAALERNNALAWYSNFGLTTTDIGAPGSDILSTLPGGGYGLNSGTSMAAPHVSGACALLRSYRPALTHAQVRELILRTADAVPALAGRAVTGGRLNVHAALISADDLLLTPATEFATNGPVGGPFGLTSKAYTISNLGGSDLGWSATVDKAWVTLSAASGTVAAGSAQTLDVTLNSAVANLLPGDHLATVTFSSTSSGRVQTRPVKVRALPPPVYTFDMETDPGWPRTGEWQYGVPSGGGGGSFGHPDPTAGATGSKVLGVNLQGDYSTAPGPAQYVTAGPFDLAAHHGAMLKFQRWLNTDFQPWLTASVEVSTDQVVWHRVWENGGDFLLESQWTEVEYDISAWADGHAQVYVRWGHEVREPDAYPLSGWNLDDIQILAVPDRQLRLSLPVELTEGGAAGEAKLELTPVLQSDLVVSLVSDRPGQEVTVPATIVIPAGVELVTFQVAPMDDTIADGSQHVTLTASATGYPPYSAAMTVHDNESDGLMLTLPATLTEGAGTGAHVGEIRLPNAAPADIEVALQSSDLTELSVPAKVTILAGNTGATFPLTVIDDTYIDGVQTVTVTAGVTNWSEAADTVQVLDNEALLLTLTLPPAVLETDGTLYHAGWVGTAHPVEADLVVNLTSGDTSEIETPAAVTIPARGTGAYFSLTAVNDAVVDGTQAVEVTASAGGFTAGTAQVAVGDDETPALPGQPTPGDGMTNLHPETDLAWQVDPLSGGTPESFDIYLGANAALAAAQFIGSGTELARTLPRLAPGGVYYWQVVARKGGVTRSGPVWSFTIAPVGPPSRLGWEPLPEIAAAGEPFEARITAYDSFDNVVPDFAGTAALSTTGGADTDSGSGVVQWELPFGTFFHDARTQSIYTPAEVGPSGAITSIALDIATPPGQPMTNFTIRLKHTSKTQYANGGQMNWENSGWATAYQATSTITATGWTWFVFNTPFEYDGTSNLMVDISFNNTYFTTYGRSRATPVTARRSLFRRADSQYGDPLTWNGVVPTGEMSYNLPNIRFRMNEASLTINPSVTGAFENGTWFGDLTVPSPGTAVNLRAEVVGNPLVFGESGSFNVVTTASVRLEAEPQFTGGTSNTIVLQALGSGHEYEIQQSATTEFLAPVSTGFVSQTTHQFGSLQDGKIYHYRARARKEGVIGPWSLPARSTQDATPPSLTIQPPSGSVVVSDTLIVIGTGEDGTSGIAQVAVDGAAAESISGYAQWHWLVTGLPDGVSTFFVTIQDKAVPPNELTAFWSVRRIADVNADPDGNGVGELLEYAFNAEGDRGRSSLPLVAEGAGAIEEPLLLSYRRRLNAWGLEYRVERSVDMVEWGPAGAGAEELAVFPTGDDVTETVLVRVSPVAGGTAGFARVRVSAP